jgi:hypothetical protein
MTVRVTRGLLPLLCLTLACTEPPPTPPKPAWSEAFDAREVGWLMNASTPPGGEPLVVGGRPDAGVILRREAGQWRRLELGLTGIPLLNWAHGFSAEDVWVAGNAGTLLHWNGRSWRRAEVPTTQDLWGVWGAAEDDVWAVGGSGRNRGDATLLHFNGLRWEQVPVPTLQRPGVYAFFKVWGTARDDVWVVGQRGALLHWNGSSWTEHLAFTSDDLISLWGTRRDHIIAVGGRSNAVVTVWNGSAWSVHNLAPLPGLNGVWMEEPGTAWLVGIEGTLARLNVNDMTYEAEPSRTRMAFHSVAGDGQGSLLAVGGNFLEGTGSYLGIAWTRPIY